MNEINLDFMFIKTILYCFSFIGNFSYIIIYFFSLCQIKCRKNSSQNLGLGCNFMFFLNISHLCYSITEILLYIYFYNHKIIDIKNFSSHIVCQICAFSRNYFELSCACWISNFTYLFYQSTKNIIMNTQREFKQIIFGIFYSFIIPLFIIIPSLLYGKFGFIQTRCSFVDKDSYLYLIFVIFIIINVIFQLIFLCISFNFYNSKIKYIQENSENEDKLLKIYVCIFLFFPIYILISRILKLIYRFKSDKHEYLFLYISEITFSLNGFFDSIICLIFLRSAFGCCKINDEEKNKDSKEFQILSQE